MNFEHYQASTDAELRTGFVQMMARSGSTLSKRAIDEYMAAIRQALDGRV